METILDGLFEAAMMIVRGDRDLLEITLRSLHVTLSAVFIASIIALPCGAWLAISQEQKQGRGRRIILVLCNALMGLPPVAVGLMVYLILSRSGPLGVLGLIFTPTAMIIAQIIIITPLIISIAHRTLAAIWLRYRDLLISLNASRIQMIATVLYDSRHGLITASLAGFGRAIGEVGAVMIVGGNIDHATRVLTTAITLETGKGNFVLAIGLGFILIALSVLVNLLIHLIVGPEQSTS
ncbi:MAG: ABC transporter permease [Pseudomonadota bacterium]